jgi:hypothetical protein
MGVGAEEETPLLSVVRNVLGWELDDEEKKKKKKKKSTGGSI